MATEAALCKTAVAVAVVAGAPRAVPHQVVFQVHQLFQVKATMVVLVRALVVPVVVAVLVVLVVVVMLVVVVVMVCNLALVAKSCIMLEEEEV